MTTTKDKLSASVRQAKAAQQPEAETRSAAEPEKAAGKTPITPKKPAVAGRKPATKAASAARKAPTRTRKETPAPATDKPATANEVRDSGTALFPERVWPD